jgi:hypothetical protein
MHIQGNDWEVEEAIPQNSTEFIKSKQLVLKMHKIESVNPKDIWFTLPTIENIFPNLTDKAPFNAFSIEIHGDDWLQQEFISAENSAEIESVLEQIRESAKNETESNGTVLYKKCFARQFPATKIKNTILLTDIQKELEADKIGSLNFSNYSGFAENTFVIKALGTYFYGQLNSDNSLQTFAIQDIGSVTEINLLKNLTQKMKLNFVDWTGMYQIQ